MSIDISNNVCIIFVVLNVLVEHHSRWRYRFLKASLVVLVAPFLTEKGANYSFSSLQILYREVVTMYITLVELLMILSLIIALAEYFNNRRDK